MCGDHEGGAHFRRAVVLETGSQTSSSRRPRLSSGHAPYPPAGADCAGGAPGRRSRSRLGTGPGGGHRSDLAVQGPPGPGHGRADLSRRVRHLSWPRRQGRAAAGGRVRAAAAQRPRFPRLHRLRRRTRSSRSPTGWRWSSAADQSARSIGTCRPSAMRCRPTRSSGPSGTSGPSAGDRSWPRGDLNLPRAFFTEKAFPENETVWTTGVHHFGRQGARERAGLRTSHRRPRSVRSEAADSRGSRPIRSGAWSRGIGDVEIALRRTFYASLDRGSIFAAGGAVVLPTGKEELRARQRVHGLRAICDVGAVHRHERVPAAPLRHRDPVRQDADEGGLLRTALGYTLSQDQGFGRAWSPMMEADRRQA